MAGGEARAGKRREGGPGDGAPDVGRAAALAGAVFMAGLAWGRLWVARRARALRRERDEARRAKAEARQCIANLARCVVRQEAHVQTLRSSIRSLSQTGPDASPPASPRAEDGQATPPPAPAPAPAPPAPAASDGVGSGTDAAEVRSHAVEEEAREAEAAGPSPLSPPLAAKRSLRREDLPAFLVDLDAAAAEAPGPKDRSSPVSPLSARGSSTDEDRAAAGAAFGSPLGSTETVARPADGEAAAEREAAADDSDASRHGKRKRVRATHPLGGAVYGYGLAAGAWEVCRGYDSGTTFSDGRTSEHGTDLGTDFGSDLDAHLDRPDRPVRQELRDLRAAEEQLLQMHEKSKALLASLQGLGL